MRTSRAGAGAALRRGHKFVGGLGKTIRERWQRSPCDDHDEPPGLCETLFPWPVRLGLVAASWLLARIWVDTSAAGNLGWTLEYAGVVAVSLAASLWFVIFVVDAALAIAWLGLTLLPPPDPEQSTYLYWTQHVVQLCNRQLSHIEAFWIWMGVLLPCAPRIDFQLPALLGLALLGPALIDRITRLLDPGLSRSTGDLQNARRPVIYAFTFLGILILLIWRSSGQRMNLLPLVTILLLGLALRFVRHARRKRDAKDPNVQAFRRKHRQLTRGIDVMFGPVFMFASVVGVLALSLWARHHHDSLAKEKLDGPPPDPQVCVAEPGGPGTPDLSIFLVADSQVHELGGERFPGQTELADLLVPSAVRPVELDMLSTASVARLQRNWEEVTRDAAGHPVFWAHLGDFADLSCTGEIQRAVEMFSRFGRDKLIGIAPGNHDMSFTGNFLWSPYWAGACKSNRIDKTTSNHLIGQLLQHPPEPRESWWPTWITGAGGLVTATPLPGSVLDHDVPRTVVAIFIDTGDDATLDWGIAGLFGTYSKDQDRRLREQIRQLKGPGVNDPLWLVFSHHPLGELTDASRKRLEGTLEWLDGDPLGTGGKPAAERKPRILALIAAHTHHAETHRVCIAKRVVRELVIGSTIDPPQQAALLEVGHDHDNRASVRLKTIPTIARPGFTCGGKPEMIAAEDCQRVVARLQRSPDCKPLFDEGLGSARDCSELEQASGFGETLRELMGSTNPIKPDEIKAAQAVRAKRLMTCVCRHELQDTASSAGSCKPLGPGDDPLDDQVFRERIEDRLASGRDEAGTELACLSWAAAAQQAHKARGMTFASALRCAFDDPTIPAAQESVATLDVHPCR